MPVRAITLLLLAMGVCIAQQPSSRIRSISVKEIATTPEPGAPIGFETITEALKSRGGNLAVERPFDSSQIDGAKNVIRDVYSASGRRVRVDHSVISRATRGVEITFEVVELCDCR